MENNKSSKQGMSLLLNLKQELEKEGFKTSWGHPFFEWLHGTSPEEPTSPPEGWDTLYISDLPVPRFTPFDVMAVSFRIEVDQIYFELAIYYSKVLEDFVDADAAQEVAHFHDADWFGRMAEYFNDIAITFNLKWDTEYDVYIEDTLYGSFPIESTDTIISLMKAINREFLAWQGSRHKNWA